MADLMRHGLSWLHQVVASKTSGSLAWILLVTLSAAYVIEFFAERFL
jgi:hypothetical protein